MELKEKLTSLRTAQGLTQLQAAEALLVSRQAISRWELGSVVPSADNLIRIGELYGVSVEFLMDDAADWPIVEKAKPTPETSPVQETDLLPILETLQELVQEKRREQERRRRWTWKKAAAVVLGAVIVALAAAEVYHLIYPYGRPIPLDELPSEHITQEELDAMDHFDFDSFDW